MFRADIHCFISFFPLRVRVTIQFEFVHALLSIEQTALGSLTFITEPRLTPQTRPTRTTRPNGAILKPAEAFGNILILNRPHITTMLSSRCISRAAHRNNPFFDPGDIHPAHFSNIADQKMCKANGMRTKITQRAGSRQFPILTPAKGDIRVGKKILVESAPEESDLAKFPFCNELLSECLCRVFEIVETYNAGNAGFLHRRDNTRGIR